VNIATLKRYDAYKNSGIAWLGDIPEHWNATTMKQVFTYTVDNRGRTPPIESFGIPMLEIKHLRSASKYPLTTYDKFITKDTYNNFLRNYLKAGDILFGTVGSIGQTAIVPDNFNYCIAQNIVGFRVDDGLCPDYYYYFLTSVSFLKCMSLVNKQSIQESIKISNLVRNFIVTPSKTEQQAIANYLDTKTAQIDRKIELLSQKAEKYGKLKQSLINETVTRGLDKSVPMKDSGIEWIGEVPAHWELKRIKDTAEINKQTLSDNTPADYEFEYIDIGSVTYGVKGYVKEKMTFESAPSRAKRIVKGGDTIISTVRTYLKAITTIEGNVSDLIVSTGFAVISPLKSMNQRYCSYLLTSETLIDKICTLSKGVSYPATNSTEIGNLSFFSPPLLEQQGITAYLDEKTSKIDQIIKTANTQTANLKELRKTLINDVVTGKIKVVE